MINERLMQPGRWELTFKPETPLRIRRQIDFRDHLVVTPTRLPQGVTYNQIAAASIYTGVVLSRSLGGPNESPSWGGMNLLYWLGDTTKTPTASVTTYGARLDTFSTLAAELFASTYTTAGMSVNYSSVPSTTIADTIDGPTPNTNNLMQLVDRWRRKTTPLTEYAIRHVGEIWFSGEGQGSAFVQTPKVLLTRDEIPPGTINGIRCATSVAITDDSDVLDEQANQVVYSSEYGASGSVYNYDWDSANGFLIAGGVGLGANTVVASDITYPGSGSTSAYDFACTYKATNLMRKRRSRYTVRVRVADVQPTTSLSVGDYFYIYDPWTGLKDTANDVLVGGHEVHPKKVRAASLRWDVGPGMGVYWLKTTDMPSNASRDTADGVEDLSDYVVTKTDPTLEIEIDTTPPFRGWTMRPLALSS